ncbi:MAG: hypothetical protein ACTS6J_12155 [Burkholderiales bacterium]
MSTDYREQAPDNLTPYLQGKADQRSFDLVVGILCAIAVAIFIVWGE